VFRIFQLCIFCAAFYDVHFQSSPIVLDLGRVLFIAAGKYDKSGVLQPWWSNTSTAQFNQRAQCFVDQYSNYSAHGENVGRFLRAFLRTTAECFARLSHNLGVRLFVCPSGLPLSPIKTVQAWITQSSLWAALRTLVCRYEISCPWVRGFPSNECQREVPPLKSLYFADIGSPSVKTVADGHRRAAYPNKHL